MLGAVRIMVQPKPKSAKIYLRVEDRFFDFMWANVMPDGSVIMGLRFEAQQQIELVSEQHGSEAPPVIEAPKIVCHPKISFHPSGHYKLDARVGLTLTSIDRATVMGPRLIDIDRPRRMLEILLPKNLPRASAPITDRDIVLNATTAPRAPFICTVSCMSEPQFNHVISANGKFVNTSTWEFTNAFANQSHRWVWKLRTSAEQTIFPSRFIVALLGEIKWGKEAESGF